jgi:hypothetical protein
MSPQHGERSDLSAATRRVRAEAIPSIRPVAPWIASAFAVGRFGRRSPRNCEGAEGGQSDLSVAAQRAKAEACARIEVAVRRWMVGTRHSGNCGHARAAFQNEWSGCGTIQRAAKASAIHEIIPASLRVALRAKPRYLARPIQPVLGVGLAGQSRDFALLATRIVRLDRPAVFCNANGLEGHFCFCHAALCRRSPQNRTKKTSSRVCF